jgi:hypothetical protein
MNILCLPSCTVTYILHVYSYILQYNTKFVDETLSHFPVGHVLCSFSLSYSAMVV